MPEVPGARPVQHHGNGPVSVEHSDHGPHGFGDFEFDGNAECTCEKCGNEAPVREFKPGTSSSYAVVLLYPDYAAEDYGADTVVEHADAEDPHEAAAVVQKRASKKNGGDIPPESFRVIAVFSGDAALELNAADF